MDWVLESERWIYTVRCMMKQTFLRLLFCSHMVCGLTVHAGDGGQQKYYAITSALEMELEAVLDALEGETFEKEVVIAGNTFRVGEVYGLPIVVFQTQVGMTNAAMFTQLALSEFPVKAVLFSGVAGAINPDMAKGEVVIPERWHYHDYGGYFNKVSPDSDEYEQPPSDYRRMYRYDNFGMFFPADVLGVREGVEKAVHVSHFSVDPQLLMVAKRAVAKMDMGAFHVTVGGAGTGGNIFMDNLDYRKFLRKTWSTDVIDMESTAIGHVCWSNSTPFLVVRGLSDLAGGQEGENEFDEYAGLAWDNAASVLDRILRELAEKP